MFLKFLIISILLPKIECKHIFGDNFNELNTTKWIVLDRKANCEKLNFRKMLCDTSNEINLRTISGTLAITAINQVYFYRKFTSASIISKRTFKFDGFNYLFRIRAALTNAPGLLPHVFLILDRDFRRRVFTTFYTIISRSNNKIWNGNSLVPIGQTPMNNTNVNEFQDYDLIISKESRLFWRINNDIYFNLSINYSNKGLHEKLFNLPFRLGITLDLDSDYSEKQLDDFSISHWNCSTFIIDSIDVFQDKQVKYETTLLTSNYERIDNYEVCKNITKLEMSSKILPGLIKPLNLLWSDEFSDNSIQLNKWIIKSPRTAMESKCLGSNHTEDSNCKIDNSNIEVSNGTLKLYPKGSKMKDQDESSTNQTNIIIASTPCFKNVRVEIRAKRPKGALLTARIFMQSYKNQCNSENINGLLEIAKLRDDPDELFWELQSRDLTLLSSRKLYQQLFGSGKENSFLMDKNFFVSSININPSLQHSYYHNTLESLDQFQNYGIEWNENGIQWLFNGHVIYQANPKMDQFGRFMTETTDNSDMFYLPFKHSFNLLIEISAGDCAEESDRPVFEIDYVRVYGNQLIGSEIIYSRDSYKQMIKISENSVQNARPMPYLLIGTSSLILILIVILTVSLIKIRKVKQKNKSLKNKIQYQFYDDVFTTENNDIENNEYNDIHVEYVEYNETHEDVQVYDKIETQPISEHLYIDMVK